MLLQPLAWERINTTGLRKQDKIGFFAVFRGFFAHFHQFSECLGDVANNDAISVVEILSD